MPQSMKTKADRISVSDTNPQGVVHPSRRFTYGAMGLQAQLYPKMIHVLRELAGGGVLQVPSSVYEFENPDTAADIERYVQSAGLKALDRVKLFKLVWDFIGSEFAGRHQQYEMFYAGAPFGSEELRLHVLQFFGATVLG